MHTFQDLLSWIQDKAEVEVVDLILRIKEKLVCTASRTLLYDLYLVTGLIDDDLTWCLNNLKQSTLNTCGSYNKYFTANLNPIHVSV